MATRCGCNKILATSKNFVLTRSLHTGARCVQQATTVQEQGHAEKIQIPRRKKRDDTAILNALASTVKKDFNAPHYKYIDDPFLLPSSSLEKRVYSLAKSSGQKAARYILENYPKYFTAHYSVPDEQAFGPPPALVHADDQEPGLIERIQHEKPLAAYESYQKIKQAGRDISESTLHDLLDLLCMCNSEDPPETLLTEERFFQKPENKGSRKIAKVWKDHGAAEQVFAGMKDPTARAYNSMIRGRTKFYAVHSAFDLYEEAKNKKIPVDVNTYNALLSVARLVYESAEERWELIQSILADMSANTSPNLKTFNTILHSLSMMKNFRQTPKWAMTVVNEMRDLGIEPSLGSYSHLLNLFYANDEESTLLVEILDHIQGQKFSCSSPADFDFFSIAMNKCAYAHQDMELAYRVDKLLNHADNIHLLGDAHREGPYYSNFLKLLCMFEQIDVIMEHYRRITPYAYSPTFQVLGEIFKAVELNDGYQYIPELWSDLVLFDCTRQVDLVGMLLFCMATKKQDTELQQLFVKVCDSILERVIDDSRKIRLIKPLKLSGPMAGDMIKVGLHADNLGKAWEYFQYYYDHRLKIEMFPSESSLVLLAEQVLTEKDVTKVMQCLTVIGDCAYPKIEELVERAKSELDLDDMQKQKLDDLV